MFLYKPISAYGVLELMLKCEIKNSATLCWFLCLIY